MTRRKLLEGLLDKHYRRPVGLIGQFAGHQMAQQHHPENTWSVSLSDIQPLDHVLEVGFGPGVALQAIARQISGGLVTGVDFSRAMLTVARRRNREAIKAGKVKLIYGEATKLPLADATFDKVLSIHTLYFWSDPRQTLLELRRVLKPAGTLILTFLPRERWPGGETATTIAGVYSGEEVIQLLHEAGFSQGQIERGPEDKTFREIAVRAIK